MFATNRQKHVHNGNHKTLTRLAEESILFESVDPVTVLGLQDQILHQIELAYPDARFTARGNELKFSAPENLIGEIRDVIAEVISVAMRNRKVTALDVSTILALKKSDNMIKPAFEEDSKVLVRTHTGQIVQAKTAGQQRIVDACYNNDIVFAIGPAGTGKTYTSVALAVKALKERRAKKIVLVRPAVEAGESLGFLPGDLKNKIDPYLRPLYDALEEMIEYDRLEMNMTKNIIEIAPLAYMRGRTLNNAFVILDEAQNATNMQMKMFLTRLGQNSRAIITGDITQTDLPGKYQSGLISIQQILQNIEGISFVYLDKSDVVRHKLIRDIIKAYEQHEEKKPE